MYQVSDSYQRFDQKNNFVNRFFWDPSLRSLVQENQETPLRLMERGKPGFELRDYALAAGANLVSSSFGTTINLPNGGLKSWAPIPLPPLFKFPDRKPLITGEIDGSRQIKHVARYFGADLVGIAKLDLRWFYSHHYFPETGESRPVEIDAQYQYVITMAIGEDYHMIQTAPSALYMAETLLTYSRMALLVGSLAQFIRQLGYRAIPSLNDTALNIPIAIDAGLGQFGRHGLLISPQFGPRQRLCKVITDLPLQPDAPIDFGVTQFCHICRKCAEQCPAQAIPYGEPAIEAPSLSNNSGVMKWYVSGEKCWEFRLRNFGTNCGICRRVCPFNKSKGVVHGVARFFIQNTPWVNHLLLWLNNRLGYGKFFNPAWFWNG